MMYEIWAEFWRVTYTLWPYYAFFALWAAWIVLHRMSK